MNQIRFPVAVMLALILGVMPFVLGNTDCGGGKQSAAREQQADPLRTLAKASDDLAGGIKLTISTKRQLAQEKFITPEEEAELTNLLLEVNRTGAEYNKVLVSANADTPETRNKLLDAANNVAVSIDRLHSQGILHIKNEGGRQRASLLIASLRAAIATIRLTLQTAPTPMPSPISQPLSEQSK
jgi:hypothetical protein